MNRLAPLKEIKALWVKRGLLALASLALAGILVWALLPQPVPVDTATITRERLAVTVDEEGKTRIKDVFSVAAPVAGKVLRSPLHVGDSVIRDETVVAIIQPAAPSFVDVRSRVELEAAVKAAEAGVALSEAELAQARSELGFAESDLTRYETLTRKAVTSERSLEKARLDAEMRSAAVARSQANVALRRRELESARARLLGPEDAEMRQAADRACCYEVKSPESGRVLRLVAESETTVQVGAPLLEIGNPSDLEIVVELLSSDAVQVKPGASATVEAWGGAPLKGRVRRIEPSGFTKVSALGIEEQRVRAILDFEGPPAERERLGHDFRVFVRIDVYEAAQAVRVPLSALFRRGNEWAVFVIEDDRAVERQVAIGRRNSAFAEALGGVGEGEHIALHPSDRVANGVRVIERSTVE